MSCKMLFIVPLIGALLFSAKQGTAAASSPVLPALAAPSAALVSPASQISNPPPPECEQSLTHTMTIDNGPCETQATFVWLNGQWRSSGSGSPCRPEKAACPEKAYGNRAPVRRHCR
jgi:hypothetical protein